MPSTLRIAAISDTHGRLGWEIPECDVFVHAGDMTGCGTIGEVAGVILQVEEAIQNGVCRCALLVPGNHDQITFEWLSGVKVLTSNPAIRWLVDEPFEFEGKTFYGSGWTPPFQDWWWMADEAKLAEIYRRMPQDIDVLITHGPPKGILDPGWQAPHVGSTSLLAAIETRRVGHHVFGHLHGAGGLSRPVAFAQPDWEHANTTYFHNVAAVDDSYQLRRGALEFEI